MIELTVSFALKFLHIFGLMLGAAAGFGSMIVARQLRQAGRPSPQLTAMRPFFGRLGLAGIVLLWVTGFGLWLFRYDLADLGPAYSLKLVTALVLFCLILAMGTAHGRAVRNGTPPPGWLPKLGMATPVLTLIAVALAVWVFI